MVADLAGLQAIKVLNMIKVYAKPIRVNKAASDKRQLEVGANLFIGNLDPDVDEKVWSAGQLRSCLSASTTSSQPCACHTLTSVAHS
jgi:hypothetical protein